MEQRQPQLNNTRRLNYASLEMIHQKVNQVVKKSTEIDKQFGGQGQDRLNKQVKLKVQQMLMEIKTIIGNKNFFDISDYLKKCCNFGAEDDNQNNLLDISMIN